MNFKVITVLTFFVAVFGVGSFFGLGHYRATEKVKLISRLRDKVKHFVSRSLIDNKELTQDINFENETYKLTYTIDQSLQEKLEKILRRYPSDHTSVVIVDNSTGAILAAAGVKKQGREIGYALPFSSTHPSASLIKLITSADLLENNDFMSDKRYLFRGKGTTLYKYQLKDKISRWTRSMSLSRAFAISNNVIFGKAAIKDSNAQSIFDMATRFGFNQPLMNDFEIGVSRFAMPDSQYNLAELASGFNKDTQVSPVHAAMMAQVIANEGVMKKPYLVDSISSSEDLYSAETRETQVISSDTAQDLRKMMISVVEEGTARRIIKGRIGRKLKRNFYIGAKTGSITGGLPYGKRDWLTLFAEPKDMSNSGISISVMNINKKKWYYKSTFIAQAVLNGFLDLEETKKNKKIDSIEVSYGK
jgi:peptidoglycan glycosyltransferase